MLAQRLLVDRQMLGDVGLSEAESRSALDEGALFGSRTYSAVTSRSSSLC
jgi:hypothetical protein